MDSKYSAEGLGAIGGVPWGHSRMAYRGTALDLLEVSKDVGCPDVSASCLECPLPVCLEDLPWRERSEVKRLAIQARPLRQAQDRLDQAS